MNAFTKPAPATRIYHFGSSWRLGERLASFSQTEIKNEPMLFSCDLATAKRLGGPLTTDFLRCLPADWRNVPDLIIDSRVHMLMPGWFPAIPGWHHDDVPRHPGPGGQPNYDNPEYEAEHSMALVGGSVCPTEFALGVIALPRVDPAHGPLYGQWHPIVEEVIARGDLERVNAPDGRLVFFDSKTLHQGVAATGNGWRFFIRATRNTKRKFKNELRRQVQVYLQNPMEGW